MYFFFGVFFALLVGFLAASKGRNFIGWAIFAFFFNVIALIAVFIVSHLDEENERDRRINRKLDEANTRIRALQRDLAAQRMREKSQQP